MVEQQQFSNRQAMADMAEIVRIARELEERRSKNRTLDFDMRVQLRVGRWLGDGKNPLRPLGPVLAKARLELRRSKLSTQRIGRARKYVAELIRVGHPDGVTVREALQQRSAAGDQEAADALYVLEYEPRRLEGKLLRKSRHDSNEH